MFYNGRGWTPTLIPFTYYYQIWSSLLQQKNKEWNDVVISRGLDFLVILSNIYKKIGKAISETEKERNILRCMPTFL